MESVPLFNFSIGKLWNYYMYQIADPRTTNYLLSNPYLIFSIIGAYLYFVLNFGPKFMKNRQPYKLKKIVIIYNIIQIISNIYMFLITFQHILFAFKSWKCENMDPTNSFKGLREIYLIHVYYFNKILDLFDTITFILRKKDKQVTFLHIYHHASMPFLCWIIFRYVPGGNITVVPFLNTFVHIILYLYYFLSGLGPEVQKYLWWKKYITKIQLIQFMLGLYHNAQILFMDNCDYPKWTLFIIIPSGILYLYLFSAFYKKSYIDKDDNNVKTN